jgi:hypothetical protein
VADSALVVAAVSGYAEIARALEHVAAWIDKELAAGTPPKWVAQEAAGADREIAELARLADRGEVL